jgi:alpha-mannosidase II
VFDTKELSSGDFVLHTRNNLSAKFSGETGLLKAVTLGSSEVTLDLEFVSYGTRDKSGAYLFLPDGDASTISDKKLKVITIAGPLVSNRVPGVGIIHEIPTRLHVYVYNTPPHLQ